MTVAIVGAGIAGLACAGRLEDQGIGAIVFDKGKRPGGRLSTLEIGDLAWDFGTQFLKRGEGAFAQQVAAWRRDGVLAPWLRGPTGALVGVPRMSSLVEGLCAGREVRFGALVQKIEHDGSEWFLTGPGLREGPFSTLVIAVPGEQAAPLLAFHDFDMAREAASVRSWPCWTVMAAFSEPLRGLPDFLRQIGAIAWAARNNSKPGRGQSECWVIQAGSEWSRGNLECEPAELAPRLLAQFALEVGRDMPAPAFLKAHRWRFAESHGQNNRLLWNPRLGLGACGDWCMAPPIEGAWRSGTQLAERIMDDLQQTARPLVGTADAMAGQQ